MKHSINSVAKLSAVFLLLLSMCFVSCKEEEQDDPNITYVSINKTVTSVIAYVYDVDSVDINSDGRKDFSFASVANTSADSAYLFMIGNLALAYVDSTEILNSFYIKVKNQFKDQLPDVYSTKRQWYQNAYAGFKEGSTRKGYAGVGDVFIPIILSKVGSSSDLYYGWLRINVTSDYRSLKLLDAAFNINPGIPVKMGAK